MCSLFVSIIPVLCPPSFFFFFFNLPAPTEIYTLSLHDALPISSLRAMMSGAAPLEADLETACARRLGCGFIQGYGLTEASPVTHANSDEPGKIGRASCRERV